MQRINALNLLAGHAGAPVARWHGPGRGRLGQLPEGLPAEVLLRRPDIIAAEHRLLGADANISAARAAFFPSIRLTGNIGSVSTELSGLFESNTTVWSFIPQINIPIFQGGRLRAALGMAQADRTSRWRSTRRRSRTASAKLLMRWPCRPPWPSRSMEAGIGWKRRPMPNVWRSPLRRRSGQQPGALDAQRTLYAAQQQLVAVRMAEQANRVTLYKVLGGGWTERN